MAQNYGFLICILVMVMDIVAGILGIQAEIAQNKVLQQQHDPKSSFKSYKFKPNYPYLLPLDCVSCLLNSDTHK